MRKVKMAAVALLAAISLAGCANGSGEDFKDMLTNLDQIDSTGGDNFQTDTEEPVVIYE